MSEGLQRDFPELKLIPVCADYSEHFSLPTRLHGEQEKKVVFFPGSTIGNLDLAEAKTFLHQVGEVVGAAGGLLIGVDLKKDSAIFNRAYDDSEGVTAEFNLNLLARMNRELDARFDLHTFSHRAFY